MRDPDRKKELLRTLCDARLRRQLPADFPLSARKAHRAARLLAHRYYNGRMKRSFQYSRALSSRTGRQATDVLGGPAFDGFVADCALGSFDSARRLGEMAVVHLDGAAHPGPWWRDLVQYEFAYFLQTATTQTTIQVMRYRRRAGAWCRLFSWRLPEVLERLRAGQAVTDDLRHECTLLFCRGEGNRVIVAEVEKDAEAVFRATNGLRLPAQIAQAAGLDLESTLQVLEQFVALGAVEPPLPEAGIEEAARKA
ncbi:MAG TPA: hypothetical protein VNK82_04630 [Terriglobales bacterium]|nr:hypothetical protein [Terriglobales bacterium]